jgi:HEAT repeat protein
MIILKEIGEKTLPLLRPLLKDKDDDIRKFALDLIYEIKSSDYPQEIARVLETDPNPNVRASAARALGVLKYKKALPQLINALKDNEWVCFSALESLALLGDESSIEPVASLLNSESEAIRYATIEALGKIGGRQSADALLGHLLRVNGFEKRVVIKNIVQMGITPSISGVSEVLMDMLKNGDWEERVIAIKGLVDLKEEGAIRSIINIAGSLDPSNPEDEERISHIKNLLCGFGCVDVFIDILDDPSIKYKGKVIAINVIKELRCEKAISSLIKLTEGNIRDIRRASIEALGNIGSEAAKQAIIEALSDYDSHVRKSAACALGKIGDKVAFEPILNLLRVEKYQDVMEEAVKALLAIDSKRLLSRLSEFDRRVGEIINLYK